MAGRSRRTAVRSVTLISPEAEPQESGVLFYPTPTSLESVVSPKNLIAIPRSVVSCIAGIEEGPCFPLVVGRTPRKTDVVNGPRRTKRRRKIDTLGMANARTEEYRNSFSSNASERSKEDEKSIGKLGEPVKTLLVARLCKGLGDNDAPFHNVALSEPSRMELENSLSRIIYPVCVKYGASLDTAFLAYSILSKYCKVLPPRLMVTRHQLYVAALMIAFKYAEEEDPNITDFCKTISKRMSDFITPSTAAVLRMEQRIMRVIEWRIADIPTPMVLTYALLDCFPLETSAKRTLAKRAQIHLESVLMEQSDLGKLSTERWTIAVLAQALGHFIPSTTVGQCARLLSKFLATSVR